MKNRGFTLAEVLITLAIIGVVAAMTVPTLMTSTRGKEYEVGANKALSTIANAVTMRYAMDGVTLADYSETDSWRRTLKYLAAPPGNRPGEQGALALTQTWDGDDDMFSSTYHTGWKLKDGMIIIRAYSCGKTQPHLVLIDTNGEKGPTRSHMYGIDSSTYTTSCTLSAPMEIRQGLSNPTVDFYEKTTIDPNEKNVNPDVVMFWIHPHTGAVQPVGQRTRNIMATGNATISQ